MNYSRNEITREAKTRHGRRVATTDEIILPVTAAKTGESEELIEIGHGDRAIHTLIPEPEIMGLVETWIESKGNEGRVKQVQTTFEPQWVHEAVEPYIEDSDLLARPDED